MKEDIGQQIIGKLDEINLGTDKTHYKIQKKVEGKKNSHLHLLLETNVMEAIKKEAERQNISLSKWCRRKLKEDSQFNRIENKLDKILK